MSIYKNGQVPKTLRLETLDTIPEENIEWFLKDLIPLGKLTLFAGEEDLGKTTMAVYMAALTTIGKINKIIGSKTLVEPANVLCFCHEEGAADVIAPRFRAAGGVLNKFTICRQVDVSFLDIKSIEASIAAVKPRLVIFDNVSTYTPGKINTDKQNQVVSILGPLAELAEKYSCAILLIHHFNKGTGRGFRSKVMGSVGFLSIVRASIYIIENPDNPKERLIAQGKHNLGKTLDYSIRFEIKSWDDPAFPYKSIAKVNLLENSGWTKRTLEEQAERPGYSAKNAGKALLEMLFIDKDEVASAVIEEEADRNGISMETMKRCKKQLGYGAQKHPDGHWYWVKPDSKSVKAVA